ncbi:MFS general substrate transporter, partial [Aspergillus ellipticus CBS 707.79]
ALDQVEADLHTTATTTNLSVALYMLAMAIFPLWWSTISDATGRRSVYLVSMALGVVFAVLAAISRSIAMLIVMRLLSGGAAASVQAVGAGTVADLWEPRERGRAMGIFFLGPQLGPLVAPIVGGALADRWGWRSTMWLIVIVAGATLGALLLLLPETMEHRRSVWTATDDGEAAWTRYARGLRMLLLDPFRIVLNLQYPAVLLTVYSSSVSFFFLYVTNISLETSFAKAPYRFGTLLLGLVYIPNSLGYMAASVVGGRWMDHVMKREAHRAGRYTAQGTPHFLPEDRMRENAWVGALCYPAAMIWYGWTVDKGIAWPVPLVANFFMGFGAMLGMGIAATMLTEFVPGKASQGVALAVFVRNTFACIGTIIASPAIDGVGNGWLFTILGLIGLASSLVIPAIRIWGPRWRQSMDGRLGN